MVVITRNRPSVLERCLDCLKNQTLPVRQIVVVDSSDVLKPISNHPGLLHQHFPAGRQQMPKARNEGTRLATGKIVAFLDDDCLVDRDWLECLLEAYQERPDYAGIGGRITDARWPYDATKPIGKVSPDGEVCANFFGDGGGILAVDFLPGGNMSFRKDWLLRVRGFDPAYVATNHREDPDLCLRLKAAGGLLAYQPQAHALHLNARNSLGELKRWHEFYLRYSFARNEAFFLARHFPHRVWRRWWLDSWKQLQRAVAARSAVALLCVPVLFISFGIGLLSHFRATGAK